jgi:branched-chain amino acid transport system substrate-binding protein
MAPCSTISGCLCRRRRSSDGPGARGVGLGPDHSACRCRPCGQPIKLALIESLSGPFANTGEAVFRNVYWAMERVNARGGVPARCGWRQRPLVLERYDSKGQNEEACRRCARPLTTARIIMQGNSSATAAALIDAINKHNEREPGKRVLFLNYSAVDPASPTSVQLLAFPL